MTTFVLLIHDTGEDAWETLPDDQKQRVYDADAEFARLLTERGGRITGGAGLTHSREARVLRRTGVSEGPFAESVEVLNGFFIVEGTDLDTLVELAGTLTAVHDVVEIRPTTG